RAGMDEHIVPVDDEGIEGAVVDDVDIDGLRAEAGGLEDRLGIGPDQSLGLGVADETRGLGGGRRDERQGKAAYGGAAKLAEDGAVGREGRSGHHSLWMVRACRLRAKMLRDLARIRRVPR